MSSQMTQVKRETFYLLKKYINKGDQFSPWQLVAELWKNEMGWVRLDKSMSYMQRHTFYLP